ncbi:MAG TPA: hypothetical protein DCM87_13190 [Planctomycetes bacterium]|nr:hypothetical protein [Planctomycetota bacterium]
MSRHRLVLSMVMCILWVASLAGAASQSRATTFAGRTDECRAAGFVENRGQWHDRTLYLARNGGDIVGLEDDAIALAIRNPRQGPHEADWHVVRFRFEGATPEMAPEAECALPGSLRYFSGGSRCFCAQRFGAVTYHELYPGIAVRVKIADPAGRTIPLEYDVVAAPGADLRRFAVAVEGIDDVRLENDGSLVLDSRAGRVCQPAPVAWIETPSGEKTPIACGYRVLDAHRYGLAAPAWDGRALLVIDPIVAWSRFIGGESDDTLYDVQVREADNALVIAGSTRSLSFPELDDANEYDGLRGNLDAFVMCLDAMTGELRSAAILTSEANDEAWALALAENGEVTVGGYTEASSFPVTTDTVPAAGANAFVARLSPDLAALEWSTALGGNGEDRAANVVIAGEHSAWVLGFTDSADFPVTADSFRQTRPGGRYDLFVAKLNTDSAGEEGVVYSTYLGGSGSDPLDFGTIRDLHETLALAVDNGGRVYVAGRTDSRDYPTTPGAWDRAYGDDFSKAFLSVLAPAAQAAEQLVYSTYLGGYSDAASINDIVLAPSGSVWACGWTFSSSFPTTADAYQRQLIAPAFGSNGFLACVVPDDSLPAAAQLAYSTFLTGTNGAGRCAMHSSGSLTVVGGTRETLLPVSPDSPDSTFNGDGDVYLTRLDPTLDHVDQHLFSTYIGGPAYDRSQGLAVDALNRAYVVGHSTSSTIEILDGQSNGGQDGFIAMLDLRQPTATFTLDGPHDGAVNVDASASTTPAGTTIESYLWDFGDGGVAEGATASHVYAPGRFTIALTVTNNLGLTGTKRAPVTATCTATGDVAPWTAADIGAPLFPGSAWREGDGITLCAGGRTPISTADEFHYVHQEAGRDFSAVVRVEEPLEWIVGARLGLMARGSTDPGAPFAAILAQKYSSDTRLIFRFRNEDVVSARSHGPIALPVWLKIELRGGELVASSSPEGDAWTEVDRIAIAFPDEAPILAGLAACGNDTGDPLKSFTPLRAHVTGLAIALAETFRRGDTNASGGLDIADAICALGYLFGGPDDPCTQSVGACLDAADANDDGRVDIADAVKILAHLFAQAGPLAAPFGACGEDPTADGLDCGQFPSCE